MPIGRLVEALQSKEITELLEIIRKNASLVDEQKSSIEALGREVSGLSSEIGSLKKSNHELSDGVKAAADSVRQLNAELEDSVTDLKLLKSQLQSRVAEKIESEFRVLLSRFEKDVESIGRMKAEMAGFASEASRLKAEVERLNRISSSIKSADFELADYARRLAADDAEKLRLMRQIDSLERLVSRLRKQGR
ncbi:hypothetical protein HYY72_04640 [Candidatus Woesearchaeota archaeon]|nr:hypothetical protein [Candidatus Woesearchaeota archaeon]